MPNVLVVDDSEVDRRLVGGLLEKQAGLSVLFAEDGKDALAQLDRLLPDVVLTDILMPEMDGLQLLSAIQRDYPLIPVILMTARGSEEIAAEALRQGAASYVPKKNLADDLVETVERVLSASREDRGHSRLMHYLDHSESEFVLRNDLAAVAALVGYLQQMLRCMPLGEETERLRVGIAVEEALKNAYYHGNLEVGAALGRVDHKAYTELANQRLLEEPYRNRRIYVRADVSRSQAVFCIRDEGPGFDHSHLPHAADPDDEETPSGRGVILMRTIMDEIAYNDAGTEVTLIKRTPPAEPAGEDDEAGTKGQWDE